ncbi:hypothetical protein [Noviherbaspirillum galbum]|uniref:Uncharacterized protein n=1 Tax=Noviherbaspirillum galbum TaxID=2709383 RepID=A0A6B3SS31_9BURK|nr:hypothetical protein [Noviherbaspirillum galbum]NEX63461.1 hypothetical protein [Noviherbaspirillum galbum]
MDLENSDEINLFDLSFNFEDYFERSKQGQLTEQEQSEFAARVMGQFCRDFYKNGDPADVPYWIMNYLADQMFKALAGEPLQQVLPMPWEDQKASSPWTEKGERALKIYAAIQNELAANSKANVTDLIYQQAKENFISFETARLDYYAIKKGINGPGIPEKFLKRGPEN